MKIKGLSKQEKQAKAVGKYGVPQKESLPGHSTKI